MLATVLHRPRDIRCEEVAEPKIQFTTDAIIKLSATCICGSDLWPYRGLNEVTAPMHMGHEYCGVVVEVGSEVRTVRPGQFVVGSFCISDNTCPALPIRLPVLLRASRVHERRAGPLRARALGGRYARGDARSPVRRSHSPLPRDFRRARHRLVITTASGKT